MNLLDIQAPVGSTVYTFFVGSNGNVARNDTLVTEPVNATNWTLYAFSTADAQGVGLFAQAFPLLPSDTYFRYSRLQAGANPVPSDSSIGIDGPWLWDGTAVVPPPPILPPNPPGTESFYGYAYLNGVPVIGRKVNIEILSPPRGSGTVTLEAKSVQVVSDTDGLWTASLVPSYEYRVFIPEEGIDLPFFMTDFPLNVNSLF